MLTANQTILPPSCIFATEISLDRSDRVDETLPAPVVSASGRPGAQRFHESLLPIRSIEPTRVPPSLLSSNPATHVITLAPRSTSTFTSYPRASVARRPSPRQAA